MQRTALAAHCSDAPGQPGVMVTKHHPYHLPFHHASNSVILPRQARDKLRESSSTQKRDDAFPCRHSCCSPRLGPRAGAHGRGAGKKRCLACNMFMCMCLSRACLGKAIAFHMTAHFLKQKHASCCVYIYAQVARLRKQLRRARRAGYGYVTSVCLGHLCMNTNILPRQARDKHRESTQKQTVFSQEENADGVGVRRA